jgi:hypothetical protein
MAEHGGHVHGPRSSWPRCPNRLFDLRHCLSENSESDSKRHHFPRPSDVGLGYTPELLLVLRPRHTLAHGHAGQTSASASPTSKTLH